MDEKKRKKINDYFHKVSNYLVNILFLKNEIDTLVIGKHKNGKQEINLGKRNNPNFRNIPHNKRKNQV